MPSSLVQFSEPEKAVPNGLGPLFNAVSCVDCHQSIADGGHSQIRELRAGHLDRHGNFVGAMITLNNGSKVGPRSLINQRDRKSTRLNSSQRCISYAVFCLKKKKKLTQT